MDKRKCSIARAEWRIADRHQKPKYPILSPALEFARERRSTD
jgi:hypothetical protein